MLDAIVLEDGRQLGYTEYGDGEGFPIVGLHGTPGSRIWFPSDDPISKALGVRLITFDRPGYGLSTSSPQRQILDFTEDIDYCLRFLKIKQFSIFGISGGGAYALAFASALYPGLYKTGIVASIFEFKNGKAPKSMNRPNRMGFFLARRFPWLLRMMYQQQKSLLDKNPDQFISGIQKNIAHLCTSDQVIAKKTSVATATAMHLKEAFRANAKEVVYELNLFSKRWGFDPMKITSEVEIWHGEADTLSPIDGLRSYIAAIPNQKTHFLKGKGHFLDEDEDIWRDILISLKP